MTDLALLEQLHVRGVILTPYLDGMLRYKAPKSTLTPDLLAAMCQQKAEPYDLVEEWSERVAMAEDCGGLARAEAERLAWTCVLGEGAYLASGGHQFPHSF